MNKAEQLLEDISTLVETKVKSGFYISHNHNNEPTHKTPHKDAEAAYKAHASHPKKGSTHVGYRSSDGTHINVTQLHSSPAPHHDHHDDHRSYHTRNGNRQYY